ncbi:response regulator [Candidatus Kaiserbacteria bacterium]|nr:response regulator [Candidatus Kaiserbacteria bacterium]USN92084.1 MAG: response regulator [Candidatus Nomurabacteria bacterium]
MSVLTKKNILIVGDENSEIINLKKALHGYGVIIHSFTCDRVTPEVVEDLEIDLILLNYLDEGKVCEDMLNVLKNTELTKVMPIFILVNDENDKIHQALSLGAADYLTPGEDVDSVILKIKTIFGEGNDLKSSSDIDITPMVASVKSTGIRVFVIEDDPLLRNLLSIRLSKSSFPFEFSNDGKDAVHMMKQFKPNVIILDLMLPGRNGLDILSDLKKENDLKEIPVIVFSNKDGHDERRRARELGANCFYVKAMTDLSELIETIESMAK